MSKELSDMAFVAGLFLSGVIVAGSITAIAYMDKLDKYKSRMEKWEADSQMKFDFAKEQRRPEKISYLDIWKGLLGFKQLPY